MAKRTRYIVTCGVTGRRYFTESRNLEAAKVDAWTQENWRRGNPRSQILGEPPGKSTLPPPTFEEFFAAAKVQIQEEPFPPRTFDPVKGNDYPHNKGPKE